MIINCSEVCPFEVSKKNKQIITREVPPQSQLCTGQSVSEEGRGGQGGLSYVLESSHTIHWFKFIFFLKREKRKKARATAC